MTPADTTLKRILLMLDYLTERRTIPQIAKKLSVNTRTVYRYLHTLNQVGKPVNADDKGRFILNEIDYRLLYFNGGVPMRICVPMRPPKPKNLIKDFPEMW